MCLRKMRQCEKQLPVVKTRFGKTGLDKTEFGKQYSLVKWKLREAG